MYSVVGIPKMKINKLIFASKFKRCNQNHSRDPDQAPLLNDMAFDVRQQPASGMIISEYCRANQISEGSFYYWLKKVKDKKQTQLPPAAILPVKIIDYPMNRHRCENRYIKREKMC
jgi:hypothetical protein